MRALLARGADVNVSGPTGETALIRAAFFGHADVVRVLLDAGADVRVKDSLGLTAVEWSVRRGFDDVARILRNHSPAANAPPLPDVAEGKARVQAAPEGGRKDAEGARRSAGAEVHGRAGGEAGSRVEPERGGPAAARQEAEALARIKAREEAARAVEESRRRVEVALGKKSEDAARRRPEDGLLDVAPRPPTSPPAHAAQEPFAGSGRRRCPKCNNTYQSDVLYCVHDSALLISEDAPARGADASPHVSETEDANDGRPWVWALVALMLAVGVFIGYRINSNVSGGPGPDTPGPAQKGVAEVEPDQPVIEGALKGKEISLPGPQSPAGAKGEGVTGKVTVAVVVNNNGEVISARAISGPSRLRAAAVKAAREAKFSAGKLPRGAARVSGTITYDFK